MPAKSLSATKECRRTRPTKCVTGGCLEARRVRSRYCAKHYAERGNARCRERRKSDPEFRARHAGYKQKRLAKRVEQERLKRQNDPTLRARIATYKRSQYRKKNLGRICTEAYLSNAHREDRIYERELRKWLKSFKPKATAEEKAAKAREKSARRYNANLEAERLRSRIFKHANPDYRERWNAKRGQMEQELSDGTLTRETVTDLFVHSTRCPYCGDAYKKSRRSLDHIIPLAKAEGRKLHSISNAIICCLICNNRKRTKSLNRYLEEIQAGAKKRNASPVGKLPLLEYV